MNTVKLGIVNTLKNEASVAHRYIQVAQKALGTRVGRIQYIVVSSIAPNPTWHACIRHPNANELDLQHGFAFNGGEECDREEELAQCGE